ncbi:hypothetical protein AAKU67_000533 [Oxalobacteraceae bacterium GrIS 2.11]
MSKKANIGFEVDEADLANAKAFVARHGGSLNKLVSALFASLGQEEANGRPALDPTLKVLIGVSTGSISITEAARILELPDAGYVFHLMAEKKLPLPRLPKQFISSQLDAVRGALDDCLLNPEETKKRRKKSNRAAA